MAPPTTEEPKQSVCMSIDPGQDGGVAVGTDLGDLLHADRLPLSGKLADLYELKQITKEHEVTNIVIEEQHWRTGDGARNANVQMPQYGQLQGWAFGAGLRCRVVRPQEWKRRVLIGTLRDKAAACDFVTRMFPRVNLRPGRKTKPHDGIADACCLWYWWFISEAPIMQRLLA